MSAEIPTEQRTQPHLIAGDFPPQIEPKLQPVIEAAVKQPSPPAPSRLGEAVSDAIGAAHGARKFYIKFADPEVMEKLDAAAASEQWYVTIHFVDNGRLYHFLKPSDRFPTLDTARCSQAVQEDARRRIAILQENAAKGLSSLDGDKQPLADERD